MKLTICYDNTTKFDHLLTDWGFACIVEAHGRKILFDTGGNGRILLENLKRIDVDPASFDDIFISHPDFDHIGGLSHILNENETAVVHNPKSFRGVLYKNDVLHYDEPAMIYENLYTTGELGNREQSLIVVEDDMAVVVIGCGHPGLGLILDVARRVSDKSRIWVVGGLHGFDEFDVIDPLEKVCPTHCTKHADEIRNLYREKFIEGGVGTIIETGC